MLADTSFRNVAFGEGFRVNGDDHVQFDTKTFNEKLQWLKLYDGNPMYTVMTDKNLVKDYVAGIIGEDHIVPSIGVWDNPEEMEL